MKTGTLISYFIREDEARGAIRKLKKRGFRRLTLVHKSVDGDIRTWDSFFWRRTLVVILVQLTDSISAFSTIATPHQCTDSMGKRIHG